MHTPVLLDKVIDLLNIKPDGFYIDATFGCGGYSSAILENLNHNGCILVIDKDYLSIKIAENKFSKDDRVLISHSSYTQIKDILYRKQLFKKTDGIIIDLGISSLQIEDSTRGFSFIKNGILDMRIDLMQDLSACKWLNTASVSKIEEILFDFGDKKFSKNIAKNIISYRNTRYIKYTHELVHIISSLCSNLEYKNQLIIKTFQAIRMFINDELCNLQVFLDSVVDLLNVNGKLIILSFNFSEEKVIKLFLKKNNIPNLSCNNSDMKTKFKYVSFCFKPSISDIDINISFRSVVIRIIKRLF